MKIKKYICKKHNLITNRKGLRVHIREEHARNEFTESNAWHTEEWDEIN